jgi:predicted amidohydrolase YtcJ
MRSLACSRFWPGKGPVLEGVRIGIGPGGRVESLEPCSGGVPGLVMPSFVDAHVHFSWKASGLDFLDLADFESADGMLAAAAAAPVREDPLVRGLGFDECSWDDPELPSLERMDAALGGRPAVLTRVCGHLSLVNSALLAMIPEGTPDVDRATGRLTEGASLGFSRMFPVPESQLVKNMGKYQEHAFSLGVTGIGSMEHLREARLMEAWNPRLRTALGVFPEDAGELERLGGERLVRWIKVFMDGTFGSGNAAVDGSYQDGSSCAPMMDEGRLLELLHAASRCRVDVCAHAIGAQALRTVAGASRRAPSVGVRVEHAEELIPALDAGWHPARHSFCMQPNFVRRWQMPGGMYEKRLCSDRVGGLNPFREVVSRGFRLGFGSDGMPFGPLEGLPGATGHPDPDQRLTVEEALRAYTLEAAGVCGFSDLAAPVAPGRPAHLCILSKDPFTGVPWEEIRVEATVLDGETVFGDPGILEEE